MKAKEYAQQYFDAEDKADALGKIYMGFFGEIGKISIQRNVQSNSGLLSVIEELNSKWKALCKILNKAEETEFLKEDGFIELTKRKIPELDLLLKLMPSA